MLVSVIGVSIGPWLKSANSTVTDALDRHPGYTVNAAPNSTTSLDANKRIAKLEREKILATERLVLCPPRFPPSDARVRPSERTGQ